MTRSAEYDSDIAKMYGTAKPSLVFSFNEDQSVGVVSGVGKAYYPSTTNPDNLTEVTWLSLSANGGM